ncbi:MAG: DHHA1 domain-containing protein [Candidatus Nanoarchaeia archaeon]|nr:DHHA1 domain-containing protein [Candidatus Nanoarchaeia archaeon]
MLTEKQTQEIKEHLEKAQNPLFFFDNDNDGLCSFLLLRRFLDRGKGVAIRSFPDLNKSYYRKVEELKPDYIFILDKPVVSKEFIEKAKEDNLPVVWIDHHDVEDIKNDYVAYYNPFLNDKTYEPVSSICQKMIGNKEDVWLAVIGSISDCYLPDFYKEFEKKYPELGRKNPASAFELLYKTEIGRISRILDFSLKDSTTNVVNMIKFMMNAQGPMDILEENTKTKPIIKKFNEIDKKYQSLIEKARKLKEKKFIYFQYGGSLSLSANLANQLSFEFPDKIIVVAYINKDIANISIRGKSDVRKLTLEAISDIEGATGGGHKNATGAKMNVIYLPRFKEKIEKLILEL